MKTAAILLCLLSLCYFPKAQQRSIDSVLKLLESPKDDKLTASRYVYLASRYQLLRNDSLVREYANKGIALAVKHNWKRIEIVGKFSLMNFSSQASGLSLSLECLRLSEAAKDTLAMINSIFAINIFYTGAEDYSKALQYSRRLLEISTRARDSLWRWNSLYSVANASLNLQEADSGLFYAQEAYRTALSLTDFTQRWITEDYHYPRAVLLAWSLHALGKAHGLLKDDQLALSYFSKGLESLRSAPSESTARISLYNSIAESFLKMSKKDSVIKYSQLCLAEPSLGWDVINVYTYLAKAYEGHNNDSAVAYYRLAADARAKHFTTKAQSAIRELTKQEDERQQILAQSAAEENENRKRNLQLSFIAIGLVSFCILFLLLSQTIIVKSGLIKFLGVLALLLLFEFINLFLHPLIGDVTHHSPVWMFIIMVGIAALLVPAHHKIEKWITHKLVEKNKRIRLAAAKETIRQLET